MAGRIGAGVSLVGVYHEDWQYPFFISGTVTQDDVGKAVTLDTTAANTVKLAGNNDRILGRLEIYENRVQEGIKVVTVNLAGGMKLPLVSGGVIARGDTVVGAGNGEVKRLDSGGGEPVSTPNWADNFVVETGDGFVVIVKK